MMEIWTKLFLGRRHTNIVCVLNLLKSTIFNTSHWQICRLTTHQMMFNRVCCAFISSIVRLKLNDYDVFIHTLAWYSIHIIVQLRHTYQQSSSFLSHPSARIERQMQRTKEKRWRKKVLNSLIDSKTSESSFLILEAALRCYIGCMCVFVVWREENMLST